jgi:RHS repeat-associated protein
VVLTQQKDTAAYLASGEAAFRATESQLFSNLESSVARTSAPGYPNDVSVTNPNDTVFRLNGSGHKMGPGLLLKVMSGDKVDIGVQYYYNSGTKGGNTSSLTDVIASLATGIVNASSGAKGSLTELNNPSSGPLFDAVNAFLNDKEPDPAGKPKAYLNWILLDEQLKPVTDNDQTYAMPVVSAGSLSSLGYTGLPISKSGYLYIWASNETQGWDLFFDNLSVKHYTGPLLEETHYYPFGLAIAGISSKALKPYYAENKYRYNDGSELQDKEFSDGSGLELYETDFRGYDPQIGRFWQLDPMAEVTIDWSPYSYSKDNPILLNDPLGLNDDTANLEPVVVTGIVPCKTNCSPQPPDVAGSVGPPPSAADAPIKGTNSSEDNEGQGKISPKQELENVLGKNPVYNLEHTVVEKPTWWQGFINGPFYEGKNVFGQKIYRPYYGGTPPEAITGLEGAAEEGASIIFKNITKGRSVTNILVGITSDRFEANMARLAGKAWEMSQDGKVKVLIYNGLKYVSRAIASSGEYHTIEIWKDGGELLQKYRLSK